MKHFVKALKFNKFAVTTTDSKKINIGTDWRLYFHKGCNTKTFDAVTILNLENGIEVEHNIYNIGFERLSVYAMSSLISQGVKLHTVTKLKLSRQEKGMYNYADDHVMLEITRIFDYDNNRFDGWRAVAVRRSDFETLYNCSNFETKSQAENGLVYFLCNQNQWGFEDYEKIMSA